MEVEKFAMVAGVGFALAVGAFVLWGPSPRPRRRGQIIGLTNLGYTCFLNALLQSLAACPIFVGWLQAQEDTHQEASFTNSLLSVIDKINGYCQVLYGDVTPGKVITSLGSLWTFAPGHQDAHELFHVFLSALQAEAPSQSRNGCLSDALPTNEPNALSRDDLIESTMGNSTSAIPEHLSDAFSKDSSDALMQHPRETPDNDSGVDLLQFRSVSCSDITNEDIRAANKINRKPLLEQSSLSVRSIPRAFAASESSKPGMIFPRSSEIITDLAGGEPMKKPWSSLYNIQVPNTLAAHPFTGLLTSQLQCTSCNWKSSVRYDKFESVSLPLPPAGHALTWRRHTLAELLSRLVTSEVIHDVQCDGCDLRCSAVKTLTLGKLPKCLCLHIPRTTWSSSGMPIKRDDPVIFPEILTLDPYTFAEAKKRSARGAPQAMVGLLSGNTVTQGRNRYRLRSVVEHRGPVDAGHFVSYRKGNRPGQWFYTSDTIVERTSLTDVLSASPYMLFYERINITQLD